MYLTPTYMMSSDMLLHFRVSLPMISVGLFIFVLSLIFCCYLVRLRREARLERGYKKITYKKKKCSSNELDFLSDKTCAVCLEDFKLMEEIGLCPCGHAFHRKCISKWLEIRNTCPMCNSQVKQQASERSTLVRTVDLPVTRV
ncbi:RING finger protein 24-like isoform X4 [Branchiostoma floridae]|uniref:RING finger protein 24-like isoform X4 n=3 Tax=Branchiostoma TaxID=7737 RepID=A0A9J7MNZ7_BRAFL|nr:RING finger protein 24-like isoform X4 [Branchiostoma floridae]CAH1257611.1 RNF24 [Branchiostoma lanceolatum]